MEQCLEDVHVFNPAEHDSAKTLDEFKDTERKPDGGQTPNNCAYYIDPSTCLDGNQQQEQIQNHLKGTAGRAKYLSEACDVSTSACNNKKVHFADTN